MPLPLPTSKLLLEHKMLLQKGWCAVGAFMLSPSIETSENDLGNELRVKWEERNFLNHKESRSMASEEKHWRKKKWRK